MTRLRPMIRGTLGWVAVSLLITGFIPSDAFAQLVQAAEGSHLTEEVHFRHAGRLLTGTLHMPATEGPHSAIVLLHGSGPADRTSYGYFPLIQPTFLDRGVAVLAYDKPGSGGSSGDWRLMTLRERAQEALAAVRYLQGREDIEGGQVGLWGGSQGGWVAPLAATMSDRVAFVITISAPSMTPAEQDLYGLKNHLRLGGHSGDVIERGLRWGERVMQAAAEGQLYEVVKRTLLDPAAGEPWAEHFVIPDAEMWNYLASVDPVTGHPSVHYDPMRVLEQLTTPYLTIFGENDRLVPVERSVRLLQRAARRTEHPDCKIVVFPDANHGIRLESDTFAPGFLSLMGEWARDRTVLDGGSSVSRSEPLRGKGCARADQ